MCPINSSLIAYTNMQQKIKENRVTYQSCLFSSLLKFSDKILQLLPLDISITWEHLHPKSMTQHSFNSDEMSLF